jgi:hypothetical protein
LYGAQTIYIVNPLWYNPPPRRGHLSRTGHIGGVYMLINTVSFNRQRSKLDALKIERGWRVRRMQNENSEQLGSIKKLIKTVNPVPGPLGR